MSMQVQWKVTPQEVFAPAHFYDWLTKPYIISKAMKQVCHEFSLTLLTQQMEVTFEDEKPKVDMLPKEQEALVRRVFLKGDGTPWSYGRVVVPKNTYQAYQSVFDELGGKLIGETLLYVNPETKRSAFEYAELNQSLTLYREIHRYLNAPLTIKSLWARRSVFTIKDKPLLVTEVYLPGIPTYPDTVKAELCK